MAKEIRFENEFILHRFTQKHLKDLFDLEYIASEIQHKKLRFDNLAFDEKTNSFVIIEYKNKFDRNVLKQARNYSNLIKENENKEYFINRLERDIDVEFDNTKIMIIGPKFSQDQIDKTEDNLELWKVTLFDDCRVCYENLKTTDFKQLPVSPKDLKITEEMLLENKSKEMKELYKKLTNSTLKEFRDVEIRFLVNKFSLRADDSILCLVEFLKSSFNIYFHADNLNNSDRTVDISKKTTGDRAKYKLRYESNDDLDYFLDLFRQTYNQKK